MSIASLASECDVDDIVLFIELGYQSIEIQYVLY